MKYLLIILSFCLLSCEPIETPEQTTLYYYAVIKEGTKDNPVWMVHDLRKKGGTYYFSADSSAKPTLIDYPQYLTEDNLRKEGAELVMVQLKIVD